MTQFHSVAVPPWTPGLFRDLLCARTYSQLLYLLLSFPLGFAYFCALVLGVTFGASMVIVWVGLPILLLVLMGMLAAAELERQLAARLLGTRIQHRPRRRGADGLRAWALERMGDVGTWKSLLYLMIKLPFGLASAAIVVILVGLSAALIVFPVADSALVNLGNRTLTLPGLMATPVAGIGLLTFTAGVIRGLAHLWSLLSASLLADAEDDQQARREVLALSRSASIIAFAGSLEETLETLIAQAQTATGTAAFAVWHIETSTLPARWTLGASRALPEEFVTGLREVYQASPVLSTELRPGQAQALRNAPLTWLEDDRYAPVHACLRAADWTSVISVPLVYRGELIGRLDAFSARHEFAPRDLDFLSAVADQAAVAIENARLFERVQAQASLDERQRLARDLHDSVSQALYGVILGIRTARTWLDRDPAKAAEPLAYALSLAEGGTAEMKALLFALRPESLELEGIVAALRKQADVLSARYRLAVDADLGEEPQVSLAVKEALFRIAQEALHNMVKHAEATHVRLTLSQVGATLVLDVKDNGLGFDPHQAFPGHLGLRSMQERAKNAGGLLRLDTAPGAGVHLTVTVPCPSGAT